jgi:alanyl-tRNA synthetase
MQQKQIYFDDPYLKEHKSIVLKIEDNNIWLAENLFFPKTKNEPNDLGEINRLEITGVEKDNGGIKIVLKDKPNFKTGDKINQKIDWHKRYKSMKLHAALHFIAGIVEKDNSLRAVAGNVYKDEAILIYKQPVPELILIALEDNINEQIKAGSEIKTYWDKERAGFRWCKIGDLVPIPCGGLHVKNISEIGKISLEGNKNEIKIRVEK